MYKRQEKKESKFQNTESVCMIRRTFLTSALDMPEIMSYIYSKSWKHKFSASSSKMCIRDRFGYMHDNKLTEDFAISVKQGEYHRFGYETDGKQIRPVSYTHLDVYKRQVLWLMVLYIKTQDM